jgi:hypothetical protein
MDSVHGLWTSAPVADGKSSPELGLAAAPGHGGSPRGGDGTGTTRRDRETTHPSPDDGEEAGH